MKQARYHAIVDLDHCGDAIRDKTALERFIRDAVAKIGMNIISGPVVCEGNPENPGLSGFAILDFSHTSVHTFTKTDEAMIDVFSCKPFEVEDVRRLCVERFATPQTSVRLRRVWWGADDSMKPARDLTYTDAYMEEYYQTLTQENREIGEFLRESVSRLPDLGSPSRLVDVACGPSALYWALFMNGFDEYHGLDAREDSMEALSSEIARGARAEMHPRYQDVCEFLGGKSKKPGTHPYFSDLCKKSHEYRAHDLRKPWPYEDGFADVFVSIFGIEHLDTREDFSRALREAYRVTKPGGRLVMVSLCETSPWRFKGEPVHCLYLTDVSVRRDLADAGFGEISVERRKATTAVELDQGYEAMLFSTAVKPA